MGFDKDMGATNALEGDSVGDLMKVVVAADDEIGRWFAMPYRPYLIWRKVCATP